MLYEFQEKIASELGDRFRAGSKACLIQSATGSGKTHLSAELIRRILAANEHARVAFVADLETISEDTEARLRDAGLRVGRIQASLPTDPEARVQVCSLQTLARRDVQAFDWVFLDECRNACAATVRAALDRMRDGARQTRVVGLDATPQRSDGQPLGDIFDSIVHGPSNAWLCEHGFIVPCDMVAPNIETNGALAVDPVVAWRRWAEGKRTIVFCASVEHAEKLAAAFRLAGVAAKCVTGSTRREDRQKAKADLISGKLLVLTSVDLFVKGFDARPTECVIFARSFGVVAPWLQALGRVARTSPGKTRSIAIDLCGSWIELGLRDEPRTWSLTGKAVSITEALPPISRCPTCAALVAPCAVCPRCGGSMRGAARIPRALSREAKLAMVSHLPEHERDRIYYAKLLGKARKIKTIRTPETWAKMKFWERFGRMPKLT